MRFFIIFLILSVALFGISDDLTAAGSEFAARVYWSWRTPEYQVTSAGEVAIRINPALNHQTESLKAEVMHWLAELDNFFDYQISRPLVVLTTPESLDSMVGHGYSLETAGVYGNGVVILAVNDDGINQAVLVHELAHHYIHVLSKGNYPIWYSEGVAQLAEWQLVGHRWFDGVDNYTYYKYRLDELSSDFYGLDDQASAYRRSFELAAYFAELDGQANFNILRALADGAGFAQALYMHTGLRLSDIDRY